MLDKNIRPVRPDLNLHCPKKALYTFTAFGRIIPEFFFFFFGGGGVVSLFHSYINWILSAISAISYSSKSNCPYQYKTAARSDLDPHHH